MRPTIGQLADDAIHLQSACNLQAVARGLVRALEHIREIYEASGEFKGTETLNRHPITVMYTAVIMNLSTGQLMDSKVYGDAYNWCQAAAEQEGL